MKVSQVWFDLQNWSMVIINSQIEFLNSAHWLNDLRSDFGLK